MRFIPYDPNEGISYPFGEPRWSGVLLDGMTQLMANEAESIVDEKAETRAEGIVGAGGESVRSMFDVKMTKEGYGALAENMLRAMNPLIDLSSAGLPFIMTALLQENPKWNNVLQAAPALKGKAFPIDFPGMCDYIGYVTRRYEENDDGQMRLVYPPIVYFEPGEGMQILSGWTGKRFETENGLMSFPLNISGMIKLGEIKSGFVLLLYGETKVGKTCSVIQTFPHSKEKKLMIICAEKRNMEITIAAAGVPRENIQLVKYENWFGFIDFINDRSNFFIIDKGINEGTGGGNGTKVASVSNKTTASVQQSIPGV